MSDAETSYDAVAYPTAIFRSTSPARLATIARLAGLRPPPVETARVLEIGAGDGMNLIALAVAFPRGQYVGFDLAPSAVARGQGFIAEAGLRNITLATMDVCDAERLIEGEFDYIIVHGLYAWVPPPVQAATMALIGSRLSRNGVAFVSYNAMPGGYLRRGIRDALLYALEGVPQSERLAVARARIAELADPVDEDDLYQAVLRDSMKRMTNTPDEVIWHDELGECFDPKALHEVVSAAEANGLRYLGDADNHLVTQAFLPSEIEPDADVERQIVRLVQNEDYQRGCFFRQTLLVRSEVLPSRRPDLGAFDELYIGLRGDQIAEDRFTHDGCVFTVDDPELVTAMSKLVAAAPAWLPVTDLVTSEDHRMMLLEMFNTGMIDLYTTPAPFAVTPGDAPCVSPLVRVMIAHDMARVCSLDHRLVTVAEEGPRRLIALLDGTLSGEALELACAEVGLVDPERRATGLRMIARRAILLP